MVWDKEGVDLYDVCLRFLNYLIGGLRILYYLNDYKNLSFVVEIFVNYVDLDISDILKIWLFFL